MYTTLTVIAALIGLFALASIAGLLFALRRRAQGEASSAEEERLRKLLFHWSLFDYAVVLLFVCGMVFLVVDLAAVMRDREAYPYYHYGYLASGFIFSLIAMLFIIVRLGLTLAVGRRSSASADEHKQPDHAHHAEHRVQG